MSRVTAGAAGLLLGLLALASSAVADVSLAVDAAVRYEDNIGLASDSSDEFDDTTVRLGPRVDWMISQTATSEFGLSAGGFRDVVADLKDLGRWGIEAKAHYRGQANADLTAVWWQLDFDYLVMRYNDSDIRDGYQFKVAATIGKRFSERFGLSGGYRFEQRRSDDNRLNGQAMTWRPDKVFDLDKHGGFLRGEFNVGPDSMLFAEYNYKSGDEATTGRFGNLGSTIDWAWDPAFGPGFQVWKIDAKQHIFDLGINHQFNDTLDLEFTTSYLDADGDAGGWGNPQYKNLAFTLVATFNF